MNENFTLESEATQEAAAKQQNEQGDSDITRETDNSENFRTDRSSTVAVTADSRTFVILGWICAALAAFMSPFFAIAGVVFGALANKQAKGSGNIVIITNIVLGAISAILGYFLLSAIKI